MSGIEWREPWHSIEGQSELQAALESELVRELPSGHVLCGRHAQAIGRRDDRDDVLFRLPAGGFAVVHLTWATHRETEADWPATRLLVDEHAVNLECITPDADDYAGETS